MALKLIASLAGAAGVSHEADNAGCEHSKSLAATAGHGGSS
jgi:hypothetical protein